MRHIACLPTRKCPAIALSLAAIVLTAFLPAQPAPARTAETAAQLDHLVHRFARAHPSFPGVALLRGGGYAVDAIHVRNLLQHTSGLYDYADDHAFQAFVVSHPRHRWTRAEQIQFAMTHGKPLFPPGTDFHYSDTGYILLGEILERVTGQGLGAAYRSLLHFDRLGLGQTYLETLEPKPPHAAPRAHQYLGGIDTAGFDPSFDLYGGGGLVSTVRDLDRFHRALLTGQVHEKPATPRTML